MKRICSIGWIITIGLVICLLAGCASGPANKLESTYYDPSIPIEEHSKLLLMGNITSIDGQPMVTGKFGVQSMLGLIPSGRHSFTLNYKMFFYGAYETTTITSEEDATVTAELLPGRYYMISGANGTQGDGRGYLSLGTWSGGVIDITEPDNPVVVAATSQKEGLQAALNASNKSQFRMMKNAFDKPLEKGEFN
jgi:hypothetical protein